MYKQQRILAIIPARGGSKGLPRKNIRPMCGKPLIAWSIDRCQKSQYIDDFIVSTDDVEIAEVAREYGANIPYMRPAEFASDTSSSLDVVKHVLDEQLRRFEKEYDYIALIEPTSPLREVDDIDNMIAKLIDSSRDSICSIGEVGQHPLIMKKIADDKVEPFFTTEERGDLRRQEYQEAFFPFGVAYIVKVSVMLREKAFYTKSNTYYKIKRYQCYEIDDIYDFLVTEKVMEYEWKV